METHLGHRNTSESIGIPGQLQEYLVTEKPEKPTWTTGIPGQLQEFVVTERLGKAIWAIGILRESLGIRGQL